MAQIHLTGVSWIDGQNLPSIDMTFLLKAKSSWAHKVIIGLVGTANTTPSKNIDVGAVLQSKQYRALISCNIGSALLKVNPTKIIDPGYTPPLSFSKVSQNWFYQLGLLLKIGIDSNYYAGEKSAVSSIVEGSLHPSSTLTVSPGYKVLISAFIKFRAGPHTNTIGKLEDGAGSPVNVPWVWSEFALVCKKREFRLLACGSSFPSHAWYLNGKQLAMVLQSPVEASEKAPAILTGKPAKHEPDNAALDRSDGRADKQLYTIGAGKMIDEDVSRYFV